MKTITLSFFLILLSITAYAEKATWTISEGATGYYLYVKQGSIEKFYTIPGGDTNEFAFTITPGDYEFAISAFNDAGESERSETVLHTVSAYIPKESDPPGPVVVPDKPTGLDLIKQGFSMIFQGIKDLI